MIHAEGLQILQQCGQKGYKLHTYVLIFLFEKNSICGAGLSIAVIMDGSARQKNIKARQFCSALQLSSTLEDPRHQSNDALHIC
jgi:hypothetical protein